MSAGNHINKPCTIIAEAGVNHNGDPDLAYGLIDAAIEAGADAVKFQTFRAENLVTQYAQKTTYQKQSTIAEESQFAMLKRLELSYETHRDLIKYCTNKGIQFLSTAFDLLSLRFLIDELHLRTLKIPSGEITNGPLLLAHAQTGAELIVSTGMATLKEIQQALGVIAFGLIDERNPSLGAFQAAFESELGQDAIKEKVTLLHCTSEYPAPPQEINLRAMLTMADIFGLKVGYSDHSEGIVVPVMAATLGASIIEKHFTLDKKLLGPDHKASLEPDELKAMVKAVRLAELALGDGCKKPTESESRNADAIRKSLVASEEICAGTSFSSQNLSVKRPGNGKSPMEYWDLMGKISDRSYQADEAID